METLIDDILSFSRIRLNEMSKNQVGLRKLVKDVIQEFKSEADGRDVHWQISPLPSVTGDCAMLRVVFVNLPSNALNLTRSRAVAEIEISFTSPPNNTIIFVHDKGASFDTQYADKLLGVFQCLHRADEFEGTGIGLANVRVVINPHGGSVGRRASRSRRNVLFFAANSKEG